MNKITAEHLSRRACVYVRQSTPDQVHNNLESQRRQYGLVERARQLGWQQVEVIDDDLGRSGSGTARPGFDRLLRMLCDGEVGAVLSIEASRLARNGRDWHTLLEFCRSSTCQRLALERWATTGTARAMAALRCGLIRGR
jgi:DNA invertase Pin-like site-specific DNA recombinase